MQRNTEISSREKADLGEINKGVELLLRRVNTDHQKQTLVKNKKMESALIVIGVFTGLLTLGLGLVTGYLIRSYIQENNYVQQQYTYHPEMFDEHGNLLPDEIVTFRFEGDPSQLDDNDD